MKNPELVVIDGCAILWVVNSPTNGQVSDYIVNYCAFVFLKLQSHKVAVVLDRYHDFSLKSSTRADRGKFSARTHFLTPTLPGKSVTLTSAITGLLATSTEITRGIATERQDLKTSHEEADLLTVQQAYQKVLNHQVDTASVICDDTDVLVLFTYFYW